MSETTKDLDTTAAAAVPEHRPRRADVDPRAAKRAERQVATLFGLSILATLGFIAAFAFIPPDRTLRVPGLGTTSLSNIALGLLMGVALFCVGAGAIHWAKKLMPDVEEVQSRGSLGATDAETATAAELFDEGVVASGWNERPIIRRTLLAALVLIPLPAIVLLRDLGPSVPAAQMRNTLWRKGERIVAIDSLMELKPEDIPIGGLVSAEPKGLEKVQLEEGNLDARAKAPIILVRMTPPEIVSEQDFPDGKPGSYQGILAFSKICTHAGCPIALYEAQTHHLLCPCHQSTFDLANAGNVVFGPAARSMPQLPIEVDSEGYLVARSDFTQPVGPSFWERSK